MVRTHNALHPDTRNRQSSLSPLAPFLPLPKYFDSQWSYAQYRIPAQAAHISLSSTSSVRSSGADLAADEKCVVGWIKGPTHKEGSSEDYQLIALTYSGGWYRLLLPRSSNQPSNAGSALTDSPSQSASAFRQRSSSITSVTSASEKVKGKEHRSKESHELVLEEYHKYGRWDGWG